MLRFIPLPPGIPEFLLLTLIIGLVVFVVRRVARRRAFVTPGADEVLPTLKTEIRIRGTLRRVYQDKEQWVWLGVLTMGNRRFTYCLTDYALQADAYNAHIGKEIDVALYGLATLAPGGAEAMQDQITDIDSVDLSTNPVRLLPTGRFANDHVVIGRILSHREEEMEGMPLTVYRAQVVRGGDITLVLELGTPTVPDTPPFPEDSMVHGSARLYGYLPEAE